MPTVRKRGVDHFVRWAANIPDTLMKRYFYPDLDKSVLFEQEYIYEKSGHTRGSTVDLTLFDMNTEKEVDMGGTFDWFGPESHPDFCGNPETGKYTGDNSKSPVQQKAAAADVPVLPQVRLATNIANGINHAFKEYDCSEIILGQHIHDNSTRKFWGQFAQSIFHSLNRQIIIARCVIPLNTLRALQVAVPSRAELEPGFYRWLERLSRLTERLGCRIIFHGRSNTLEFITNFVQAKHKSMRAELNSVQSGTPS